MNTHEHGGRTANDRPGIRWSVHLPCRFSWNEKIFGGEILDLSPSGAFIGTEDGPPAGTAVWVSFFVDYQEITANAVVIHAGHYWKETGSTEGFGIRFDAIPAKVVAQAVAES